MRIRFSILLSCLIFLQLSMLSRLTAQTFNASVFVYYDDPIKKCAGNSVILMAFPSDDLLYSFSWTGPGGNFPVSWNIYGGGVSASYISSNDLTSNGIYTVLITELSTGDTSSASVSITTNPSPVVNLSGNNSGCEGTTSIVKAVDSANGINLYGPYIYSWNGGLTTTNSDSLIFTFGPALGLITDVFITNSFGCSQPNQSNKWMFGSPTPVNTISSIGSATICAGKTVDLSATVSHPSHNLSNVTYQWKKYGTVLSSINSTITVSSPGRYRCIATANGCSKTSNYIDISNLPLPIVTITSNSPISICIGQTVQLTAIAPTATTYLWKKFSAPVANSNNDTLSVSMSGKYRVVVTDANGCSKASSQVEVIGPPNNQVSASGPLTFCLGDSVIFTATSGYNYQWRKNNINIPSAISQSYTAKSAGIYKVIITDNYGCTVASSTRTVIVNCRVQQEQSPEFTIITYPNPVNSQLSVLLPDQVNEEVAVYFYDLSGRLIYHSEYENVEGNEIGIDVKEFKIGAYLLKVNSNGTQFKSVVVKQ